jgi:hypothetical protein
MRQGSDLFNELTDIVESFSLRAVSFPEFPVDLRQAFFEIHNRSRIGGLAPSDFPSVRSCP